MMICLYTLKWKAHEENAYFNAIMVYKHGLRKVIKIVTLSPLDLEPLLQTWNNLGHNIDKSYAQ